MITDKFVKGYAVLRSKWLNGNILDEYIPFVATIIVDEDMAEINEDIITKKMSEKYGVAFQPTFIRQVLSQAISKHIIVKEREKFIVNKEVIGKYILQMESFSYDFNFLLDDFEKYANAQRFFPAHETIEETVLKFLENYDDHVLYNNIGDITMDNAFIYHWSNYILQLQKTNEHLFDFVQGLCFASLIKTALFYSGELNKSSANLTLYLDTPMIFALMGMDTLERSEAYKYLIKKASSVGMTLKVFDQNFEEAKSIMERASRWATSTEYDSSKANKVAQFFHDCEMADVDISEYIHDFEASLNALGITKEQTNYLPEENLFQADEIKLFEAIKQEYGRRSLKYKTDEAYDNSIQTDVRSLVMTQRKRAGSCSTNLKSARCIFITTNNVIAKVSKDYSTYDELTIDKIPVSITADLFGTLMWLDYPAEADKYGNLKLIADCKALIKPTATMIATFNLELEKAYKRRDSDLTEEKFLFLRSHPIVKEFLLDATNGDYSQFDDNTWVSVYGRIIAKAQYEGEQKYIVEKSDHEKTKSELLEAENKIEQKSLETKKLQEIVANQNEKYSSILSTIVAILIFAIPYLVTSLIIIFIQNSIIAWSIKGSLLGGITVVIGLLVGLLYKKTKARFKQYFQNKLK